MRWKDILFGGAGGGSALADAGLLVLRAFAGLSLALAHGRGKLPPKEGFVQTLAGLGFPAPEAFAWAAGFAEFGGGLLLAVGLLTRPAAAVALFTMAVAGFIRHANDPFKAKELAFLYGVVMLCFVLAGAGRFSLDSLLFRKRAPASTVPHPDAGVEVR